MGSSERIRNFIKGRNISAAVTTITVDESWAHEYNVPLEEHDLRKFLSEEPWYVTLENEVRIKKNAEPYAKTALNYSKTLETIHYGVVAFTASYKHVNNWYGNDWPERDFCDELFFLPLDPDRLTRQVFSEVFGNKSYMKTRLTDPNKFERKYKPPPIFTNHQLGLRSDGMYREFYEIHPSVAAIIQAVLPKLPGAKSGGKGLKRRTWRPDPHKISSKITRKWWDYRDD